MKEAGVEGLERPCSPGLLLPAPLCADLSPSGRAEMRNRGRSARERASGQALTGSVSTSRHSLGLEIRRHLLLKKIFIHFLEAPSRLRAL